MGSHFFLQDIFLTEESNCLGKRILYQRTTSEAVTCVEGFLFMRCFHSMVHRWFSGRFLACHTGGLGSGSFPSPCSYSIPSGFLPAVQESLVRFLGLEDPLQKGMAAHSSILAWRTPWTEEPGRLQSGVTRIRPDLATKPSPPQLLYLLITFSLLTPTYGLVGYSL